MSVEVQIRRGSATNIAANTPAQGELWFNTTSNQLVAGDGATAGGWAHALSTRRAVADAAYVCAVTDRLVAYTALTAARTVTLPAAASFPGGAVLAVIDESGACNGSNLITVAAAGADTIQGLASIALGTAYASVSLESNGSSKWAIVSQPGLIGASPHGAAAAMSWVEQSVTLSGASTTIPLGVSGILMAVGVRVTTLVTGCTSITIGDSNSSNHWGSGIGLTVGSTNGPGGAPGSYYNGSTSLFATAVGGGASFTAGALRVSALMILTSAPTS